MRLLAVGSWLVLLSLSLLAQEPVAPAQTLTAEAVLAQMRTALGGDTALDAVKTFSASGTSRSTMGGRGRSMNLEMLVLLPDHYLTIGRDRLDGPAPIDITYYNGIRGDVRIRRTDSDLPFPADPVPADPAAAAAWQRQMTVAQKRELARLTLVLFGRSFSGYPLDFTYIGVGQENGRRFEVIDAKGADGFVMRLAIDGQTHLPAVLSWIAPTEYTMTTTTSSTVVTRGNQVVSRSDPAPGPTRATEVPPSPRRLEVSDFKVHDGLNWPRRFRETGQNTERELSFRSYKINPKLDARKFDIR